MAWAFEMYELFQLPFNRPLRCRSMQYHSSGGWVNMVPSHQPKYNLSRARILGVSLSSGSWEASVVWKLGIQGMGPGWVTVFISTLRSFWIWGREFDCCDGSAAYCSGCASRYREGQSWTSWRSATSVWPFLSDTSLDIRRRLKC